MQLHTLNSTEVGRNKSGRTHSGFTCLDSEDLCRQRVRDRAAEAVHGCALPGYERIPQQAGSGG